MTWPEDDETAVVLVLTAIGLTAILLIFCTLGP